MDTEHILIESINARYERTCRRFIIAIVILVIVLLINNMAWLNAWTQYDYADTESTTHTVDVSATDGVANYIGNDGDINNGENKSNDSNYQD